MGHSGSVKAIAFTRDGSKLLTSSLVDKTVRLWDTATGALLQTLAVWGPVYRFSFSIHGQYVETNRGRLDISGIDFQPATVTPTHSIIKQQPVMSLQGVFIEDEWIRNGGNRMLWLPPEYRPSCSDVHDGVIGLGHLSGNVSLFEFDFSQFSH
jgi:WD40 repeat protein